MAIASDSHLTLSGKVKSHRLVKLFNDITTDETKSDAIDARGYNSLVMLVETATGVTGGVVEIEAAASAAYTGTWVQLGTVTTAAGATTYKAAVANSAYPYVRLRVTTVISGGAGPKVDAYIALQKD